jgi:hypothetical protein
MVEEETRVQQQQIETGRQRDRVADEETRVQQQQIETGRQGDSR